MKRVLSLATVFMFLAAQQTSAQDAKAKAILDGVSKKVNSLKSFKADFTLKLQGKAGKVNETKKGNVAMKGQKYHVVLGGQEIICDNKTMWTYNKDAKEVQVSTYNPSEHTLSPAKLFTNFYDKEYRYSYKGERKENGKNNDVIELLPMDQSKQFSRIELLVDKSTSLIASGNLWEKNGNKYQYTISNFNANANVADTYFGWNAKEHAGVEVVDLR